MLLSRLVFAYLGRLSDSFCRATKYHSDYVVSVEVAVELVRVV